MTQLPALPTILRPRPMTGRPPQSKSSFPHKVCVPEKDAEEFEVHGLIYRPLLDVMAEAFQSPAFMEYHTTPFEYR
ncbi:hypothetical protein B0H10DRAFT_2052266 [Mycena sp. CBHHK59/15]|nr:hypothetical protein B0H10DRAFT_2052266 [Mycena sp. CBHHK59/15]